MNNWIRSRLGWAYTYMYSLGIHASAAFALMCQHFLVVGLFGIGLYADFAVKYSITMLAATVIRLGSENILLKGLRSGEYSSTHISCVISIMFVFGCLFSSMAFFTDTIVADMGALIGCAFLFNIPFLVGLTKSAKEQYRMGATVQKLMVPTIFIFFMWLAWILPIAYADSFSIFLMACIFSSVLAFAIFLATEPIKINNLRSFAVRRPRVNEILLHTALTTLCGPGKIHLPVVLLSFLISQEELGYYSLIQRIMATLLLVEAAQNFVINPLVAAMRRQSTTLDILNLSAQLKETILLTTIISSLGALVLYYIYPYLLNLFDVVYSEDLDWIVIGLGLNAILGLCIGPVGNILILNDQEKIVLVSECFRSISIIILGFLVISLFDLYTLPL